MFYYDFDYDNIISFEDVKKDGVLYDETDDSRFSYETYREKNVQHYERLFYTDFTGSCKPFTGLLYDLFPDGKLSGYGFYENGYIQGDDVSFFHNGQLSRYVNNNSAVGKWLCIEWFENGNIKIISELTNHGRNRKYIEYDIEGNIIIQKNESDDHEVWF